MREDEKLFGSETCKAVKTTMQRARSGVRSKLIGPSQNAYTRIKL